MMKITSEANSCQPTLTRLIINNVFSSGGIGARERNSMETVLFARNCSYSSKRICLKLCKQTNKPINVIPFLALCLVLIDSRLIDWPKK